MKKILLVLGLFFISASPAFASLSYVRTPAGSGDINAPISMTVTMSDYSEMADCNTGGYDWGLGVYEYLTGRPLYESGVIASTTLSHVFTTSVTGQVGFVDYGCWIGGVFWGGAGITEAEGNGDAQTLIFTVTAAAAAAAAVLFTATPASDLLASVGSITSVVYTSSYGWIIVAVAIPLAFYIIARILAFLFPAEKEDR